MRVTDTGANRSFLLDVNRQREALDRATSELYTGSKLQRPSDDPFGAERVMQLKAEQSRNEQYLTNGRQALDQLSHTDAVIEQVQLVLNKTMALTSQGASAAATPSLRSALATQVKGIKDQLLSLANTAVQGKPLFAGTMTNVTPFAVNAVTGAIDYAGNSDAIMTRVDDTTLVQTNVTGDELFAGATFTSTFTDVNNNVVTSGDVFDVLDSIQQALTNDDTAALLTGLDDLRAAVDQTDVVRSEVGATLNHLDSQQERVTDENLRLLADQTGYEAADQVGAIVRLNESQTALQATLGANARVVRLSLLDYLR